MAFTHIADRADSLGLNGGTSGAIDSTGADLIVLVVAADAGGIPAATDISDSKGNSYTLIGGATSTNTNLQMFYCAAPTVGAAHTFTVTKTGSAAAISIQAWSGAHAVPLDTSNFAFNNSSATLQPGSTTPAGDDGLFVGGWTANGAAVLTGVDSSFAIDNQQAFVGGTSYPVASAYKVQTTGGAENPTFTQDSSIQIIVGLAVFIPSSAPPDPPDATYAPVSIPCEGGNVTITPDYGTGGIPTSSTRTGGDTLPTGATLNADGTVSFVSASMLAADIGDYDVIATLSNAGGDQTGVHIVFSITANPPVGHWDTANILTTILKATPVATTHDFTHDSGPAVDPDSFAFSPPLTGMSINATTGRVTLTYGRDGDRQNDTRVITFATPGGQVGSTPVTIRRIFTGSVPCNSGAATWVPVLGWGGGTRRTIGHRMAGFPKTGQPNIGAHSTGAPE